MTHAEALQRLEAARARYQAAKRELDAAMDAVDKAVNDELQAAKREIGLLPPPLPPDLLGKHFSVPARLRCHAAGRNSDGECSWANCPQLRDGEPHKSGRHCPARHPRGGSVTTDAKDTKDILEAAFQRGHDARRKVEVAEAEAKAKAKFEEDERTLARWRSAEKWCRETLPQLIEEGLAAGKTEIQVGDEEAVYLSKLDYVVIERVVDIGQEGIQPFLASFLLLRKKA